MAHPALLGFYKRTLKMAATAVFTMGLPFTLFESPVMKELL